MLVDSVLFSCIASPRECYRNVGQGDKWLHLFYMMV